MSDLSNVSEGRDSNIGDEPTESVTAQAFDNLSRNFQKILDELSQDDHLSQFRREYERQYRALEKTIQNEKTLYKKCQELNSDIVENAGKVDSAMKLSKEDQKTIENLREEITKAWEMVEDSNTQYRQSQQVIKNLSDQIQNLNVTINKGKQSREGKDRELRDLMERKKALEEKKYNLRRKTRLLEETLHAFEKDINAENETKKLLLERSERFLAKVNRVETEYNSMENNISVTSSGIHDMRRELDAKSGTAFELNETVKNLSTELKKRQEKAKKGKSRVNNTLKRHEELSKKVKIYQEQLHRERELQASLLRVHQEAKDEFSEKKDDKREIVNKLENERKKYVKFVLEKKKLTKKLQTLQEGYRGVLRKIERVESDKKETRGKWGLDKKTIEKAGHEKDVLKYKVVTSSKKLQDNTEFLKQSGNVSLNLRRKMAAMKNQIQEKRKKIHEIENVRERYSRDAGDSKKKFQEALEGIKIKKLENGELQKRISDNVEKFKQRQQRYEQVRADRNNYNRALIEANEEIAFLKRKFDIMKQQMDQLDEGIIHSERELGRARSSKKKLEELREKKNMELASVHGSKTGFGQRAEKLNSTIEKLDGLIKELDENRVVQRKKLQIVTSERDILGTQLIRRNDEVALLNEKVTIFDKILRNGTVHLNARKRDCKLQKIRIKQLQRDLVLVKREINKVLKFKQSIEKLKIQIEEERKKVRALTEEVEDPKKLSRWRKVQGKDDSNEEMWVKIQKLQKRLILTTEEIMFSEMDIQKSMNVLGELEKIRKKQPKKDRVQELNNFQEKVRKQTQKMKTLASEINMQTYFEKEMRYEIEKMNRDVALMKKEYFSLKKLSN